MRAGHVCASFLAASLIACQPPPPPAPRERAAPEPLEAAAPPRQAVLTVTSLSGAWRVAAIDGKPLNEPYGLALTGDENRLWWEPACAGIIRNYRINGGSVRFTPTSPPVPAGSPTRPVCTIGLTPRLVDVSRALDAASTISRTPENGILIEGGGHSITLFSQ